MAGVQTQTYRAPRRPSRIPTKSTPSQKLQPRILAWQGRAVGRNRTTTARNGGLLGSRQKRRMVHDGREQRKQLRRTTATQPPKPSPYSPQPLAFHDASPDRSSTTRKCALLLMLPMRSQA
ncbi:hypothetical protein NL676_011225 [Syzygium grande]|nr:hypothetical protein NL676_011225 [Syzygium grande]